MPLREFDLSIAPDGRVEVHIKGFKGRRCLDVAAALAEIVGAQESHQLTGEAYEPEEQVRTVTDQRLGGRSSPQR